jgi:hypothetical protein
VDQLDPSAGDLFGIGGDTGQNLLIDGGQKPPEGKSAGRSCKRLRMPH